MTEDEIIRLVIKEAEALGVNYRARGNVTFSEFRIAFENPADRQLQNLLAGDPCRRLSRVSGKRRRPAKALSLCIGEQKVMLGAGKIDAATVQIKAW
jgi:hypothetical protein